MDLVTNICERDGKVVVSSRKIAKQFRREHRNVLRSIKLIQSRVDNDFFDQHFVCVNETYKSPAGLNIKKHRYNVTKTGYYLLCISFTTQKAMPEKKKMIILADTHLKQMV